MVKRGAAVLDVGVSRVAGKLAGDVATDVWDVAGWVSPNPGGVGPMTRAMLLSNIVTMAEQAADASRARLRSCPIRTRRSEEPAPAPEPGPAPEPEPGLEPEPSRAERASRRSGATPRPSAARSTCHPGRHRARGRHRRERGLAAGHPLRGRGTLFAAVCGLVLPNRDAGMLAVRNRFVDAAILAGLGRRCSSWRRRSPTSRSEPGLRQIRPSSERRRVPRPARRPRRRSPAREVVDSKPWTISQSPFRS